MGAAKYPMGFRYLPPEDGPLTAERFQEGGVEVLGRAYLIAQIIDGEWHYSISGAVGPLFYSPEYNSFPSPEAARKYWKELEHQ